MPAHLLIPGKVWRFPRNRLNSLFHWGNLSHFLVRVWLGILLSIGPTFSPRIQAAEVSREYQLKAVFLFRLAQFVEWPESAFQDSGSPLVIGIYGENPFGEALDLAVRDETARQRKLTVLPINRIPDARQCHILFISNIGASALRDLSSSLSRSPVLTVSDVADFVPNLGGMVQFLTSQNKVNLRIDPDRAKSVGLVIDSRLLRMAEIKSRR